MSMMTLPHVHRVGAATITRIDETVFPLAPERLFPAWTEDHGRALAERFAAESLDLTLRRVPLKTHLWLVELDGHTIVVDTGIGNGKSRPFSALFDCSITRCSSASRRRAFIQSRSITCC